MLFFVRNSNLNFSPSTNFLLSESDISAPFFTEHYYPQTLSNGMSMCLILCRKTGSALTLSRQLQPE